VFDYNELSINRLDVYVHIQTNNNVPHGTKACKWLHSYEE
jgi:hypothetical protein